MNMINLNTEGLNFDVGMEFLYVEQPLFQILLEFPCQNLTTVLGDPNDMELMMICAVGTESDLHAHMLSKPLNKNCCQPSAGGFHPRANARGPQPVF